MKRTRTETTATGDAKKIPTAVNSAGRSGKVMLTLAAALTAFGITAGAAPSPAQAANAANGGAPMKLAITSTPFVINGTKTTVPTTNADGETYIGLRILNDRLGLNTSWNASSRKVTVQGRGRTLVLDTANDSYTLNGQLLYGPSVILSNGSTYMPFRFLLEQMGYLISYDAAAKTIGVDAIAENKLSIGSGLIEGKKGDQSWSVSYPVISGFADANVQTKINTFLKSEAESYTESGKQTLAQASSDNAQLEADNPDASIPPVSYDGTYFITYNEAGKLSLYVDYYLYTGGAHGITARVPYTFDLKTGDTLTLRQAAGGNADYVAIFNKAIKEQIKARGLTLLAPFESIEPDSDFFLKHDKLVVYFTPYEYTAYAEGFPEFALPFSAFD